MSLFAIIKQGSGIIDRVFSGRAEDAQLQVMAGEELAPLDAPLIDPPSPVYTPVLDEGVVVWRDLRSMDSLRHDKWEAIKADRKHRIDAGFAWGECVFDSSEASRANISGAATGAVAAMSAGLPFSVIWTLKDNTTVRLDARQMIEVGLALMAHVDAQHEVARNLRLQIDAAQTPEEIDAITWAEDDPSNASTAA
jgi:hypothetical protein